MYCSNCGKEVDIKDAVCKACNSSIHGSMPVKNTIFHGKGLLRNYNGVIMKPLLMIYMILAAYTLLVPEKMLESMGLTETYKMAVIVSRGNGIVLAILVISALYRMFEKAGIKGWKAFIPIYNLYCLLEIAENDGFFLVSPLISVVGGVGFGYCSYSGKVQSDTIAWCFFILAVVGLVLTFVDYCGFLTGLARRFGHSWFYAVGLFFLPVPFMIMLGWGGTCAAKSKEEKHDKKSRKRNVILSSAVTGIIAAGFLLGASYLSSAYGDVWTEMQQSMQYLSNVTQNFPGSTSYSVCPICNGTGFQYIPNLNYDPTMGWIGGNIGCSGCGGSGRIY